MTTRTGSGSHVHTRVARNLSEFKTACEQSFVPLRVSGRRGTAFSGRIRSRDVGDAHISEVLASRHLIERTPELIARSDENYFKLSMQLSGTGILIQDDREAVLHPGDIAIYDTGRPYTLVFDTDVRVLVIMFSRSLLDIPARLIEQLTAVTLATDTGVGAMIPPFLAQFAHNLDQLGGAAGVRLANSALDLITTMLSLELEAAPAATDPRHALVQRIRDYVENNLSSPELGPAQIAAAHYISTRHLHGLFHEQGTTVSSWIRTRRLEHCRRELRDPLFAHQPIAAIAARWGFVDAAHFSRVFKAAFEVSPTEMRGRRAA
ncbi:helix-turn-helix domain-containing protein [Klugiella xanthotipulae]|uniref:AraC family transcriptional regulator n=1 Tax=Klugiella xanthotipulae TaxID=244735 RepID=A0A543HYT3_9MICO|nr:helix-turn-helix domain-containing protein [Klugiella xanthotipulae]TQM63494.1 AraC family transcriptional regulator [Klugiella xanthotipulae]